ncbi:MAG: molybdenum cofactor biosynthesis protein B [Myxococcota bacterium]
MSVEEQHALGGSGIQALVIVVASSRTCEDDSTGSFIVETLGKAGHSLVQRRVVANDRGAIAAAVQDAVREGNRLVITTGGTGISGRDVTPEALEPLFRKSLPGFGEIFRRRSWAEVGSTTLGSRATAGIVGSSLVFALPESAPACALALNELILPGATKLLEQIDNEPLAETPPPAAAGWERTVVDGTVERGIRLPVPSALQGFGPAEQVLAQSGEGGRLTIAGQAYTLWGFPDLGPQSKVLAIGTGQAVEIVALHRHHPTGIGSSSWWTPPGDLDARVDAVVGQPLPVPGMWFGCTSEAVYVESDGRILRFDGRRTTEMGTPKQALATLMLELSRR